jgi:hypothetical protein
VVAPAARVRAGPVAAISAFGVAMFVVTGILQCVAFPNWDLTDLDSEV